MPNRVRTMVISVVALVWGLNFTMPVFMKDYEPRPDVNVAFMAIIGILSAGYKKPGDGDS